MIKIYLDPGHGGKDSGAVANGLREKDITLIIAKQIQNILVNGYENVAVRMSRTDDQTVSLSERTRDANKWEADFFLSIHVNAGGGKGYEDFIHNKLSSSSNTAKLRYTIHDEIIKTSSLINRGKKQANFHVLRETTMSALLTENGFIDNELDACKMKQTFWLEQVALGHANGLGKAFGLIKRMQLSPDKYIEIVTDTLWTYHTPKWTDRAVMVKKGDVFTLIGDQFKVGSGFMYKLKSGLYITASLKYVKAFTNK